MLEKTLLKIHKMLGRHGIPYMLIGGYAMAIHGFARMTQDLDLSLGLDSDEIEKVMNAVKDDFIALSKDPVSFARETNVLLLQDRETGVRVDLIFTFIEFERDAIEESDEIDLNGEKVRVVSLENLIVYKMLAGRERDKEDVAVMLAKNIGAAIMDSIGTKIKMLSEIMQNDSYDSWISLISKTDRGNCRYGPE